MKIFASVVYRVLVPKYFRTKILEYYLPKQVLKYYQNEPEKSTKEIAIALDYLRRKPLAVFPYDFQDEYITDSITVFRNPDNKLPYVIHEGKRLYFKKRWGTKKVQYLYNLLLKEQDNRSAHKYLTTDFSFDKGEILIDAGVAEGNFALEVVEKASKLILFEADREWIEPLKATFEPWKHKVQIINKYVGNTTDDSRCRIDDIIAVSDNPVFFKIDVEGAETQLIEGCKNLLTNQEKIKVAIATYHKQNDAKEFSDLFNQLGFNVGFSAGFMLFFYDKKMRNPYFRRGLLRAHKN